MSNPVISVENLSKSYKLGQINTGTFSNDLKLWWARARGKPNPLLRIGEIDHGNRVGEELWALKDVSFQVQQGEVLGIIGRNGAGKSTLLKILSRVTAPTSGLVKVKGRIASLLEVGTGFHPELTGRENIFLNGAILGMTKQEVARKFDEIVNFAEVEKFIDTPVKRYSSGMYVRLAFSVAAHLESEIMIVDEVLAVGDTEFQKKCLGKMGDVAEKEGRTVFFVSHNLGAIKQLCTYAIILNSGRVNFIGDIQNAISSYVNAPVHSKSNKIFDRTGSGRVLLETIKTVDSIGQLCANIPMGTDGWLELHGKSDRPLQKFSLAIQINNNVGDPIVYYYDQYRLFSTDEQGHFSILAGLGEMYLLPGQYSFNVWLGRPGFEELDYVKNASLFNMVQSEKIPVSDSLSQKLGYIYRNYQIKER